MSRATAPPPQGKLWPRGVDDNRWEWCPGWGSSSLEIGGENDPEWWEICPKCGQRVNTGEHLRRRPEQARVDAAVVVGDG